MKKTIVSFRGLPELAEQPDHLWEAIYTPHLRHCLKMKLGDQEVAVSALMTPRECLEDFLRAEGLDPSSHYELGALYVAKQYRHLGLASEIVTATEEVARGESIAVVCCIMEWNKASLQLFLGLGYKLLGAFAGVDGRNLVLSPQAI